MYVCNVLGVNKQCPNMTIFGEAAVLPLLMRAHTAMLKYWDRIRNMEDDTLVKLAYKENIQTNSTWCKTIQLLNSTYQLHTRQWTQLEFPNIVKKKITSHFTEYWKKRIIDPSIEKKLGLYSKVKQNFQREPYLHLPSFRDRQIISKIMCSSHKLQIERGRHLNIPREDRLCKLCNMNKVEDEEHFMLECPTYNQLRKDTIDDFDNYASIEGLFHMAEPCQIANFLRKAYDLREQLTEESPDMYRVKRTNNVTTLLQRDTHTRSSHSQKHNKGWA